MDQQRVKDLEMLVDRKWDPRQAKGKQASRVLSGLAIAFGVLYLLASSFLRQFAVSDWIIFGFLAVVVAPPLWYRWHSRQTRKIARQHDYVLCPWCQYVLVDLSDHGPCPECGVAYERELCRTLYKAAYAPIQPDWNERSRIERIAWRRAIMLRDGVIQPSGPDDSHPSPAS